MGHRWVQADPRNTPGPADLGNSRSGTGKSRKGGDFSVGHIVLDFDLKLLLCWTNAFGHTLLGSFVYVVICWAVEDTLCWAVGHWASVALCWAVIIICTLLGSFYCMESVGHVQQSY